MEQQTNFTCRVDADLKQAFLRAAKANDRPASVLIRDFMREYVQQSTQGRQELKSKVVYGGVEAGS